MVWLKLFLRDRTKKVAFEDKFSMVWDLSYAPQGSVLFPLLFNFCVKVLGKIIPGFEICCSIFLSESPGDVVWALNQCMIAVVQGLGINKLKMNSGKTEVRLVEILMDMVLTLRSS